MRRAVLQGTGTGVVLQLLNLGLGFGSGILAARLLGPAGLGQYAYALAIVGALSILAAMGLPTTSARFVSVYAGGKQWDLARGLLRRANILISSVGMLLAFIVAIGALRYASAGDATYFAAAPLVPLLGLTALRQRVLQGLHHPVAAQVPEQVVKHGAFLVVAGSLWLAGGVCVRGPGGLMAVWLAANVAAFGAGAMLLHRLMPAQLRSAGPSYDTRRWLYTAWPLLVADGAGVVYATTDTILLGILRPAAEVGLYQVAVRMASLLLIFLTASNWVLAPWFARLHAEGARPRLQAIVTRATRAVFAAAAVGYSVFLLAGRDLLGILFGQAYLPAWGVLLVLGAARLVDVGSGPVVNLLAMTGGQRILGAVIGAAAAGNLALCVLLIPHYGMYGAATGTAVAMVAANLSLAVFARRTTHIRTTVFG